VAGIRVLVNGLVDRAREYGRLLMFSHSLFSLPFAVLGVLYAAGGSPQWQTVVWVVVGFLGGRNAANAVNRVVDRHIDAENPRTRNRALPAGRVSVAEAWAIAGIGFALLVLAAANLNPLCVALLPVAALLFVGYSFTKRFTWLSHLVLGLACAAAPVGGWIAVTAAFSLPALVLGAADALWVAGFDVIYATQDVEVDRSRRLHSLPAAYGVPVALGAARAFHATVVLLLAVFGVLMNAGLVYYLGVGAAAALLTYEHVMVRPENPRSVTLASYSVNQVLSLTFFAFAAADILIV
jgi:4-hydroxybenzoate polyprenyltransferase